MNNTKIFVRKKKNSQNDPSDAELVTASHQSISEDTNDDEDNIRGRKNLSSSREITYTQVYQFLLTMLAGNKFLLNEILEFARIMFKEGVRTPEMANLMIKPKKKIRKTVIYDETKQQQSIRSR